MVSAFQSLRIHPDAGDPELAQQQSRFNTLVEDVAQWRAALAEWKERIERYHQSVEPVRRELHAAWREWVFALDHASLQPGLSRAEREQLDEMVRETAAALLQWDDDAGIAAVLARHAEEPSPAPSKQETAAEALLEDLVQDWEQQAAAAAAQREARAAQRRAASVQKRRQQEEQAVSQSLRDVYRRLASALHPDREPDAQQRARKTALMQQANQAYADENLLALLELQLQAEQIDAAHLASVDRRRLQHYVTVLQEQLADLQAETQRLESEFRAATGLAAGRGLQPRKADRMITSEANRLRGELQQLRLQTRALADEGELTAWLRAVRQKG
ncbi:J domain-containing protein [Ramlibacter sp. G-1-2-2]|uniref:J domain-containing protein n=1 Tax=Ramlibacter agri TaxID=2728837 RepID=A0A848H129_9BURK|nr:J domain-containing protein [Ramlibacter agri]NML44505.1 J domain-containing protein [Ramlibacter agri]